MFWRTTDSRNVYEKIGCLLFYVGNDNGKEKDDHVCQHIYLHIFGFADTDLYDRLVEVVLGTYVRSYAGICLCKGIFRCYTRAVFLIKKN